MDSITVISIIAALLFFAVALGGGVAVLWIANLSKKWKQLSNALAGGVLIGVALCHMLGDNLGDVDPWGKAINKALGGDPDEAYPLGLALAGCGFFLIVGLEYLLGGHGHSGHEQSHQERISDRQPNVEDPETDSSCSSNTRSSQANGQSDVTGLATLIGISIHSTLEGVATGAARSEDTLGMLVGAVILHKGFAAYAVGASLLDIQKTRGKLSWWALVVFFAATGPIGIIIGDIMRSQFNATAGAVLQCTAAGTLLAVGIGDMVMPAFEDTTVWKKRKLFASVAGFALMALLAIWA